MDGLGGVSSSSSIYVLVCGGHCGGCAGHWGVVWCVALGIPEGDGGASLFLLPSASAFWLGLVIWLLGGT